MFSSVCRSIVTIIQKIFLDRTPKRTPLTEELNEIKFAMEFGQENITMTRSFNNLLSDLLYKGFLSQEVELKFYLHHSIPFDRNYYAWISCAIKLFLFVKTPMCDERVSRP